MGKFDFVMQAVFDSPWAILPDKYEAICAAIEARIQDLQAVEKVEFTPSKFDPYVTPEGVGVLPIIGTMAKRMNLFMEFSGGTSTEMAAKQVADWANDPRIRAIVLDIDSPGGAIDGMFALADTVYKAREAKPIIAAIDGIGASAAYVVASAAHRVFAERSAQVGSIGVLLSHVQRSEDRSVIKRTFITAGKYKAMGNSAEPLDNEAREYLQGHVDEVYSMMIDTIAHNRGASASKVLKDMADGRIFLAPKAKRLGMIDVIGERSDAIRFALQPGGAARFRAKGAVSMYMKEAVGLVLSGKAGQIEDTDLRKEAEGIAAACKTQFEADQSAKAKAEAEAKAAAEASAQAKIEGAAPTAQQIEAAASAQATQRAAAIIEACTKLGLDGEFATGLVKDTKLTEAAALQSAIAKAAESQKPLAAAQKHDDGQSIGKDQSKAEAEAQKAMEAAAEKISGK